MQANAEAECTPDMFASREVQRNTILHTITLTECEIDQQIYTDELLPRLETNRYRPRALAIKKADIQILRLLLGVALQTESIHNDSALLWMFLSGNADFVIYLYGGEDVEPMPVVAAVSAKGLV
jgi:hypothetical protein